jgi:hypothetical protein
LPGALLPQLLCQRQDQRGPRELRALREIRVKTLIVTARKRKSEPMIKDAPTR